ncbi:hypothetical protein S83_047479, partial [Arachis hypogaea]
QRETLLTAKNQLPLAAVPPVTAACEFRCGGFDGGLRIIATLVRRSAFATIAPSTRVANALCLPFTDVRLCGGSDAAIIPIEPRWICHGGRSWSFTFGRLGACK